jgi:hypothetical protein
MSVRRFQTILLSLAIGVWQQAAGQAQSLVLHVATNGSDSASGRLPETVAGATEGPLRTLPAALRAARAARRAGQAPGGCTLLLRGGRHELDEAIVLGPEDSGAGPGALLVLAAFPGEEPVLSGGRLISGWTRVPDREGLWEAPVPGANRRPGGIRSLFVNGQRRTRARTPNEGAWFRMDGARIEDKPVKFKFRPGDLKLAWAGDPDAELVAFEKWTDFRQPIRAIDAATRTVTLAGRAAPHTREAGARYFVENVADCLDAPGEWRFDRQRGVVRYLALPGEIMADAEIIAGWLDDLLVIQGNLASNAPVRHVALRGLTFSHTDWSLPEDGYTDTQAAVGIRGDVRAEGAVDCAIEDCAFTHLAGYAIELGRGCQRWRIVGNEMSDLGAGGVRLGETARRSDPAEANHSHVVTDNHLHHGGLVYPPAVGVLILQSGTNRVAHNHIHHLFYTAVSVGWNWGYQETPCRENVIESNHLHHIGQGLLSDMGAVYTLGIQRGTVVRHNLIHDVEAFTYGGWGLYPDEGSTGIVWENNVVYRCKSAGFHQHYGRENVVRNNVFAFNREHQLMRTREEAHVSFHFTNNIVLFNSGDLLGSNWKNEQFRIDGNIYFDTRGSGDVSSLKLSGASWDQWRARGHDTRSLVADPRFIAPERFDFRLREDSPALKLGFQPIDISHAGVRPKARRVVGR